MAGQLDSWLDLPGLVAAIDLRLADLAAHPDGPTLGSPVLSRGIPRSLR